mmetsp:Transcript_19713/g.49487  ORF Transcript_19713/g.49487 Transcript_19713/m.49487 type:complete len:228 (-) Transcript_19713:1776-2459(-)
MHPQHPEKPHRPLLCAALVHNSSQFLPPASRGPADRQCGVTLAHVFPQFCDQFVELLRHYRQGELPYHGFPSPHPDFARLLRVVHHPPHLLPQTLHLRLGPVALFRLAQALVVHEVFCAGQVVAVVPSRQRIVHGEGIAVAHERRWAGPVRSYQGFGHGHGLHVATPPPLAARRKHDRGGLAVELCQRVASWIHRWNRLICCYAQFLLMCVCVSIKSRESSCTFPCG